MKNFLVIEEWNSRKGYMFDYDAFEVRAQCDSKEEARTYIARHKMKDGHGWSIYEKVKSI